jgi:hypothetical protein
MQIQKNDRQIIAVMHHHSICCYCLFLSPPLIDQWICSAGINIHLLQVGSNHNMRLSDD